jgi:hypothetical protein
MFARSAIMNAVRLLTALAVMLSAISGLRAAPTFRESVRGVEAAAEIIIAPSDEYSHAHSHDDDCDGGPCLGHPHEHKDHSHVVFGLPAFPLERPPCRISIA